MSEHKETFHYTYSAAQQKEIEKIRRKYTEDSTMSELDKMEQLRQMDAAVTNKATVISLCMGIIGALVMGFGMSLIMTDLGIKMRLTEAVETMIVPGVVIGVIGMIGVICAYPLYQSVLKKERKKVAPQILKLTEELSGQ